MGLSSWGFESPLRHQRFLLASDANKFHVSAGTTVWTTASSRVRLMRSTVPARRRLFTEESPNAVSALLPKLNSSGIQSGLEGFNVDSDNPCIFFGQSRNFMI